jgi:hypothetical protein
VPQDLVQFPVYVAKNVSIGAFVAYWAPRYQYKNEHLYAENIGRPLTSSRIRDLFEWKNGSRLSLRKERSVEVNYIARVADLKDFPETASAQDFLEEFSSGGAIWRIFWLHCWQPTRFPIYDQHVHRAMTAIQDHRVEEIASSDSGKVESYLHRYLPFYELFKSVDSRQADKALWFYGKLLKVTRL